MSGQDALSELLSRLASEGATDSSGSFSLNLFNSHQRLRESLLEDPTAYLFKLIQAGIALDSSAIFVAQRRQDLQVSFPLESGNRLFEELPQAFNTPLDQRWSRSARHLALGLYAAHGQNMEYVACLKSSNGSLTGYLVGPEGLRALELPGEAGEPMGHIRMRKRPSGSWLARLGVGARLQELSAVSRMGLSACPIYLDGRPLTRPRLVFPPASRSFWDVHSAYSALVERLVVSREPLSGLLAAPGPAIRPAACYDLGGLVQDLNTQGTVVLHQWRVPPRGQKLFPAGPPASVRVQTDDRILGLGAPPGEYRLGTFPQRANHNSTSSLYCSNTVGLTLDDGAGGSSIPCHAFLSLPCSATGDSQLQLIHDGLPLRPQAVDLGFPGTLAVVSDPHIQTDISQLAAVQDERYEQILAFLREQVREMLKEVRSQVRFGEKLLIPGSQQKALNQLFNF